MPTDTPTTQRPRRPFTDQESVAVAVALAVAGAGAAVGIRLALNPVLDDDDRGVYTLATGAVLVAAALGGARAGILCTALIALAADYIWLTPRYAFGLRRPGDVFVLGIFVAVGLTVSTLAGRLRRSRHHAETLAADEASTRVAAQQSEERFRRIFEQSPLGIVIVGLDRRIQDANPMFCHILGYPHDEIVGRTVESLTFPADVDKSVSLFTQLNEGRIPGYSMVKRYVRKSGEAFWGILSVAALRDAAGRPTRALGMVQDITDRKRMEQALQRAKEEAESASHAKDQFLAVLSHELRTPLTPVLLAASSLEVDSTLPEAVREDVHMIRQNVEIEARLIDDLLDLTGIARGKLTLHRTRVDVHDVIRLAVDTVDLDFRDNRLRLETHLDAARATVDGDPARLQQVFWNLLKNATKFTPAGGAITIRSRDCAVPVAAPCLGAASSLAREAESGSLLVEVEDTGVGIAAEVLPRLFRPFEQGPAGVTQQFGGLGLGLAISRSIVEMHGGSISVASAGPGQGAIFTVRLPLASTLAPTPAPPSPPPPPPPGPVGPLRILLVEDHPATRRAMASILQSLGHDVRPAATLADALALSAGDSFDLVISDLALPDGSGHELMRQLRSRGRPPRGIAVSGYGMPDDVRRSLEAGFDEHLTKPVSREAIGEAIAHVGQVGA